MEPKSGRAFGPYPILLISLLVLCLLALRSWRMRESVPNVPVSGAAGSVRSQASLHYRSEPASDGTSPPQTRTTTVDRSDSVSRHQAGFDDDGREQDEHRAVLWALDPQPLDVSLLDKLAGPPIAVAVAPPLADEAEQGVWIPAAPLVEHGGSEYFSPRIASRERPLAHSLSQPVYAEPARRAATIPVSRPVWPRAVALREQLALLAQTPAAAWAAQIGQHLDQLESWTELDSPHTRAILEQLERAARQAPKPTDASDPVQRTWFSQVCRVRYGVERRVEIWRHVVEAVREEPTWRVSWVPSSVIRELQEIDKLLPNEGQGRLWRQYLLLDQVWQAARDATIEVSDRQTLARRILSRMTSDRLTEEQRWFVAQPALARFHERLRQWAYEPPDYVAFLEQLEAWEQDERSAAPALVEQWQRLAFSPWEQPNRLARAFDLHYRNANIRVAIAGDMVNRLLPPLHTVEEDVEDHILGTPIVGRSRTVTRLFVELIPDRMRWRLGFEAVGQVQSQTWAERGSVSLLTHGSTRYRARKLLTIDRRGIFAHHTETEADNEVELADVSTGLDGMPLLGSLLRSIARRAHSGRLPEAKQEVEQKVSSKVAQRLDEEVAQRIYQMEKQYRDRLLTPLTHLNMALTALDMHTTSERLIARYRLAADHQLSAHTPRPMAPADSWLSVQVHESAINNVLEQLRLEDRRARLTDLYREITAAFGKQLEPPEKLPDNIIVHFAAVEPIRVRFADDRVYLTMRFQELRSGRNTWHDFEVHTALHPRVVDRQIELVRDDVIELRGALSFADRLPLRAIFTALLARERTVPLLDPRITQHERLQDTHVSQLVLIDGWLGMAISPTKNTAQKSGPVRVSLSDEPARDRRSARRR